MKEDSFFKNKSLKNLLIPGLGIGFLVTIIGIIIGLIGTFGGNFSFKLKKIFTFNYN